MKESNEEKARELYEYFDLFGTWDNEVTRLRRKPSATLREMRIAQIKAALDGNDKRHEAAKMKQSGAPS